MIHSILAEEQASNMPLNSQDILLLCPHQILLINLSFIHDLSFD